MDLPAGVWLRSSVFSKSLAPRAIISLRRTAEDPQSDIGILFVVSVSRAVCMQELILPVIECSLIGKTAVVIRLPPSMLKIPVGSVNPSYHMSKWTTQRISQAKTVTDQLISCVRDLRTACPKLEVYIPIDTLADQQVPVKRVRYKSQLQSCKPPSVFACHRFDQLPFCKPLKASFHFTGRHLTTEELHPIAQLEMLIFRNLKHSGTFFFS